MARIKVPDLVGFGWEEARNIARAAGLTPRAVGPDGQPVNGTGGVVIEQAPRAGQKADSGDDLALRVAFGGGPAGKHPPRSPLPNPREFEDWLNLPSGPDIPHSERTHREPALAGQP
ncbi:MAG: PASTA domain-containing protein [Nakamurella sp.]